MRPRFGLGVARRSLGCQLPRERRARQEEAQSLGRLLRGGPRHLAWCGLFWNIINGNYVYCYCCC